MQKFKLLTYFTAFLLLFPKKAFAAVTVTKDECFRAGSQASTSIACLPYYLGNIIQGAFALAGIATVILMTLSGIRLLVSGGDPIKVEKAKKSMTYSIIGFVIILLSYGLLNLVSLITGAKCLTIIGAGACS